MEAVIRVALTNLAILFLLLGGCGGIPAPGSSASNQNGGASSSAPVDPATLATVTGRLSLADTGKIALFLRDIDSDTAAEHLVAGELVVQFEEELVESQIIGLLADRGMELIERSPSGLCRVATPDAGTTDPRRAKAATLNRLASLRGVPGVRHVGPHQRRRIARIPGDRYYPLQWHCSMIHLPEAWDLTTGSEDIVVAVIDTGVLSGHPDLQGRLVPGYDFIADRRSARDGDGRDPDPEDAGDQYNGPGRSSFHGTHVAGLIGANTENGIGVAGIAWRTQIMPLRALGLDGGTSFDVAEAIRYAAGLPNVSGALPEKPARIINLSVASEAGAAPSAEETDAIRAATHAGVLVIAAAGNDGSPLAAYPAGGAEVLSVGSVDIQALRADYSNFGESVDLVAPGGVYGQDVNGDGYTDSILSTGGSDAGQTLTYGYLFNNGTSMAAPQVAGTAALMLAAAPALSASEVREILEWTARDLGPAGRDDDFGFGLIDAAAAVREALRRSGQPLSLTPVMTTSTSRLDFGSIHTEFRVRIGNAGGGYLTVSSVDVQTLDGEAWLQAGLSGAAENASASEIVVNVNRAGLEEGTYQGEAIVRAEGLPPAVIRVQMAAGGASGLGEPVYVLIVPAGTMIAAAQDVTTQAEGLAFALRELPPGDYVIYAGTDRNDDGYICDEGDLCGAMGSLLQPQLIHLEPAQAMGNADFNLVELAIDAGGRPQGQPVHLPRLR